MAVVQTTVNTVSSVGNILSLVVGVMSDALTGKSAAQIMSDATPAFVSALEGLGDLKSDVANHADLENTVALAMAQVSSLLIK